VATPIKDTKMDLTVFTLTLGEVEATAFLLAFQVKTSRVFGAIAPLICQ
jgi:hypothetical protein